MIERASGDGRLDRRLRQIATKRRSAAGILLVLWRPAVVTLIATTVGAMWPRAGGDTAHGLLIGTAVVAVLVICTGRGLDTRFAATGRLQHVLRIEQPPAPSVDNSLGDAASLFEIRRRPASQITWVSLAKSPVPRH